MWLSRKVYTKIPLAKIEERLASAGKRLIVSDIDGVLHKGLFPGRYNVTYADFALQLLPRLPSTNYLRFIRTMMHILLTERKEKNETTHINDFVSGLKGIRKETIQKVSTIMAPSFYPCLIDVITCLRPAQLYLATKTLEPIAKQYQAAFSAYLQIPVEICSSVLRFAEGKVNGLENIVTADQKAASVNDCLAMMQPHNVIAFGDSKEDVPFFSLHYPAGSLRVAVNPKDEEIKNAADIWSWSWKELRDVFAGIPPPSPAKRKKRWFLMGMMGLGALAYTQDPLYSNALMQEGGKMSIDWVTSPPPKKKESLLVDLHVHVCADTTVKDIVEKTSPDVDVIGLADKSLRDLSFSQLKKKLEKENIPYLDKGYLLEIPRNNHPLYVAYAQEKSYKGFHILSIGHKTSLLQSTDPLVHAQQEEGLVIIAHPYTVESNHLRELLPYTIRRESSPLPFAQPDALETFNAQNLFFWCASNVHAQRASVREKIPGLASSDTHGVIEDIGLSGTYFPKKTLDFSSDHAFYASLKKAIISGHYERKEHYASPITFIQTIVAPWVRWYHYGLLLGVVGGCLWVKKQKKG